MSVESKYLTTESSTRAIIIYAILHRSSGADIGQLVKSLVDYERLLMEKDIADSLFKEKYTTNAK